MHICAFKHILKMHIYAYLVYLCIFVHIYAYGIFAYMCIFFLHILAYY